MDPRIELQVAVAKVNKYASAESGDTVEIIERPRGGISIVVADGQRSGRSAKAISNIVVRKAIALLAEGVRDGAVARATHDYLHAQRGGKVSAEFNIVSVDLVSQTVVISRNSRCPMLLRTTSDMRWLDEPSDAIGIYRHTKPAITELPIQANMTLIVVTDGVWRAGASSGSTIDIPALLDRVTVAKRQRVDSDHSCPAHPVAGKPGNNAASVADTILAEAMRLDKERPRDDATVLVVMLMPATSLDKVRRLDMRIPL